MKGIVRNYRKELARRQAKEVSFCELPEIVVEKLIVWDDYESEYTTFDVCGTEIRVLDEELAEALKHLPEQSRNIVDCQHFFRQIFLGYFSDIVQAFDTLRTNVCGDDYTSLHNPIVLSSVLPAYGMFHSIQILFL